MKKKMVFKFLYRHNLILTVCIDLYTCS